MEQDHRGKGFMKNKLVMSFYRAGKPTPPVSYGGKAKPSSPSPVHRLSFAKPRSFGGSDGYVHGPNGGSGDQSVDMKAASYISSFKERLILEELVVSTEYVEKFTNDQ